MPQDHFVAQTYLKPWCDPANRDHMHAYRKSDLKQFPCKPYDVCRELNGDIIPNYMKDPAALGQFRSIFEPRWNEAVEAVRTGRADAGHKFVISGYWANLTATTPTHRRIGSELFQKELRSIVPTITEHKPLPSSFKFTVDIDTDYIRALSTRALLKAAWQIYNQLWIVIRNETSHPFLTSDNPSTVFPPPKPGMPAIRILPLSPTLCVTTVMELLIDSPDSLTLAHLTAPPRAGIQYGEADRAAAMMANCAVVLNAEELVFARKRSSGIAALVKKYQDYQQQLQHTVVTTPENGTFTHGVIQIGKRTAPAKS
jgi:hypothetical protein